MGFAQEVAFKGETLGIFWRSIHSTICSDCENFSDASDRKLKPIVSELAINKFEGDLVL